MHLRTDRDLSVSHWLLCSAKDRAKACEEWEEQGIAVLRCGGLFTAIRVPAPIVYAAAGTKDREGVSEYLTGALCGGPVFADQAAAWFYCLVPASACRRWDKPGTECFGRDTYVGVPHPSRDARHPMARSYWSVPMDGPGNLCSAEAVAGLVDFGRLRPGGRKSPRSSGRQAAVSEVPTVDAERMRRDWSEALELTGRMPPSVPVRDRVDPLTVRLREHVERLVPDMEAAIAATCHDTTNRKTARWLLARVRTTLDQGPGPGARTAAVHMEDLALSCRALPVICSHLEDTGELVAIAHPAALPPACEVTSRRR